MGITHMFILIYRMKYNFSVVFYKFNFTLKSRNFILNTNSCINIKFTI